jgi:hypothetical protein
VTTPARPASAAASKVRGISAGQLSLTRPSEATLAAGFGSRARPRNGLGRITTQRPRARAARAGGAYVDHRPHSTEEEPWRTRSGSAR